jgi:hypothetical protein
MRTDTAAYLSARRNKVPLVVLACRDTLGIASTQLRDRKTLPIAEGDFGKALFQTIAFRRQPKRHAHQLHRFTGAPERARHVIAIGGITAIARE